MDDYCHVWNEFSYIKIAEACCFYMQLVAQKYPIYVRGFLFIFFIGVLGLEDSNIEMRIKATFKESSPQCYFMLVINI